MNNIFENKLSMYQKVQGYLALHTIETAGIVAIVTLKTLFDTKVNAILSLAASAGTDITGFTVDKQAKRNDLKAKIVKLSTAIVAYSAMIDNFKLIEKCDETPSAIDAMRDNDFYTYAKLIISEATPLMTFLTPYGVVAADLTSANTVAATYLTNIQNPRVQINERSRSLSDIEVLFADADTFLNEKLDKVMRVFTATNASLYRGYEGSRGIDQTRGNIAADYLENVPANAISLVTTLPYLSGRTFEIENTGTVALTFSLSATANTLEGTVLRLDPEQYAVRKTTNLNTNAAADKLYVQNLDPTIVGAYKVWIVK
jgi:hypothetical protein